MTPAGVGSGGGPAHDRDVTFTLALGLACADHAVAQTWQPPTDAQRCPSSGVRDDQRGSGNHMKPETVLRATRLIDTGQVFELGQVLSRRDAAVPGRRFEVVTKRTRTTRNEPARLQRRTGRLGDWPGRHAVRHLQPPDDRREHVHCVPLDEAATRTGFTRLGVEQVGALMTRGVLIDVAALKRVPVLSRYLRDHAAGSAAGAGRASNSPCSPATPCSSTPGGARSWGRTSPAISARAPASASPPPSGWHDRIRCWSAPTTPASRCPRPDPQLAEAGPPDHARGQRHPSARESAAR